jgi:Secretion system C-terminal sorting domain/Calcineurin-like phosphoesterase
MKLVKFLACIPLLSISLKAQEASSNYDGPYVFQRSGKTVVKQLINGQYKDLSASYASNKLLTCQFADDQKFSFPLKKTITTDAPEVETLPNSFFVVSDMEGEFKDFSTLLKKANVIDSNYKWNYGKKHLYIIGDMVDRGQSVTETLWLIYKLEDEAKAAGGAVHYILGNHEVMAITGDVRYVHEKYTGDTGTVAQVGETLNSIYATNSELGRWLRAKNVIERYKNVAFVHGGITNGVAALDGYTYQVYNDVARHYIKNNRKCMYPTTAENDNCKAINSGDSSGLYWDRSVANGAVDAAELDESLAYMVVDRMIIGHTTQDKIKLHGTYGEKVLNIDIDHHDFENTQSTSGLYYGGGCYYRFTTSPTKPTSYTKLFCPSDDKNKTSAKVAKSNANDHLQFSIAPNPVQNELNISLPEAIINTSDLATEINIYNLIGTLIDHRLIAPKQTQASIDVSNLPTGNYIFIVANGNYKHQEHIIKK